MEIFEPIDTVGGRDAFDGDNVLTCNLSTGLDEVDKFPTLMIVAAL